ncbi:MAG TPA: hypothetical protein VGC92_10510, partial [Phenylobacterium sp.]
IPDAPEAPSPDTIVVQLAPRLPRTVSAAARPLRLHRTPAPAQTAGPPVSPLPAQPSAPALPALAQTPGPAQPPDLRAALRHGVAGCVNGAVVGLTPAERERCNERLGRNMTREPFLPAPLEGRIRAYYDAVIAAKAPDPQPVRLTAQGASGPGTAGMFSTDERITNGHGPAIGCKIHFGVGKKQPSAGPHALTWGPCYIEPPKGSLTPEVDITPP